MELIDFLSQISEAPGPSGYEDDVASIIRNSWGSFSDSIRTDQLGNVIALKKGVKGDGLGPIMLAAHMDEIGFIVTEITENGFLHFNTIGGVDPRLLPGQEVLICSREKITGVIGAKPPHVQSSGERKKTVPLKELFIDCGLSGEELKQRVHVGDVIVFKQPFSSLQNDVWVGKAMDDRAGVGALFIALKELSRMRHDIDIAFVATVQEELGLRGAITSSFTLNPSLGIAVDVGIAHRRGLPEEYTLKSGQGPGLGWGPHVHIGVFNHLKNMAKKGEVPYQIEASPYPGGTDTYAIQMTRCGVPTALLSIPLGYMHTPVEMVDSKDIIRTGRLLATFCADVDVAFLEGLSCC